MQYSKNLISGKKISKITFGTANFFLKRRNKTFSQSNLLKFIIKNNVNCIDTSDQYGNGKCEEIIGNFIKKKKINKKIILSTKFGQLEGFSNQAIQKSIDNSLKRLKTENIDLYYFHSGSNKEFDNDKLWTILDKNVKNGKINKLGISLKTKYLVNNNLFQLNKGSQFGVKVINLAYNPLFKNAEKIFNNNKYNSVYQFTTRLSFASGLIFKRLEDKKKKIFFNSQQNKLLLKKQNEYKNNSDLAIWCLKKIIKNLKIQSTTLGFGSLEQAQILKRI